MLTGVLKHATTRLATRISCHVAPFLLGLDPELVGLGVDSLLQKQIHLFSSEHVRQSWERDSSTGLSGKSFRYG